MAPNDSPLKSLPAFLAIKPIGLNSLLITLRLRLRVNAPQCPADTCGLLTFFFTFVLLLLVSQGSEAKTLTVDDDGEAGYPDIQEAIDASSSNDTIRVWDGVYHGFAVDKNLTVTGNGTGRTVVDGGVIEVRKHTVTIENLSFEDGYHIIIWSKVDSVIIRNLLIQDCGDGIRCRNGDGSENASIMIENVTVKGSETIWGFYSGEFLKVRVVDCWFEGCVVGLGFYDGLDNSVENCEFVDNRWGVILSETGKMTVTNCSFTQNNVAIYDKGENTKLEKNTFSGNEWNVWKGEEEEGFGEEVVYIGLLALGFAAGVFVANSVHGSKDHAARKKEQLPRRALLVFPVYFDCRSCGARLKKSQAGRFRCSGCDEVDELDQDGKLVEKNSLEEKEEPGSVVPVGEDEAETVPEFDDPEKPNCPNCDKDMESEWTVCQFCMTEIKEEGR
jgi:parallel beta-helix repeat protein